MGFREGAGGALAAVCVAAAFAYAGIQKLVEDQFAGELLRSGLVPAVLVPLAAGALPLAEIAVALLLIGPLSRRIGWVLAGALTAGFAVVHLTRAVWGDPVPCNCFGVRLTHDTQAEHLIMLGLCVLVVATALVVLSRGPRLVARQGGWRAAQA